MKELRIYIAHPQPNLPAAARFHQADVHYPANQGRLGTEPICMPIIGRHLLIVRRGAFWMKAGLGVDLVNREAFFVLDHVSGGRAG